MEGAIGLSRTAPWIADEPADLKVYRQAMKANGLKIGAASVDGWVSGRILEKALRRIDGEVTPKALGGRCAVWVGRTSTASSLRSASAHRPPNSTPARVASGRWSPSMGRGRQPRQACCACRSAFEDERKEKHERKTYVSAEPHHAWSLPVEPFET